MPTLADYVTASECREINLSIFRNRAAEYGRSGRSTLGPPEDAILRKIRNVQDSKIRRNLRAIEIDPVSLREAWAHHMAVSAGTHLWPDANHRTGNFVFNRAVSRVFRVEYSLVAEAASVMRIASKLMRAAHNRAMGTYYTVHELSTPFHPYRMLYARFAPMLVETRF